MSIDVVVSANTGTIVGGMTRSRPCRRSPAGTYYHRSRTGDHYGRLRIGSLISRIGKNLTTSNTFGTTNSARALLTCQFVLLWSCQLDSTWANSKEIPRLQLSMERAASRHCSQPSKLFTVTGRVNWKFVEGKSLPGQCMFSGSHVRGHWANN